jgi:hypothetical protein
MGVLKVSNAPDMMTPIAGKYIMLIGVFVVVVGIIKMIMNKKNTQ